MLHLICHPDSPANTVKGIGCMFELQENGRLWIRYHIEAPLGDLILTDEAEPERTDELWKTTCFEVFLMKGVGPEYIELNFSPSSHWAAYNFSGYRDGIQDLDMPIPPEIGLDMGDDYFALEATVQLSNILNPLDIFASLSVVVEEIGGNKSYWALAHPDGPPDFHHRDCFTLELSARSGL